MKPKIYDCDFSTWSDRELQLIAETYRLKGQTVVDKFLFTPEQVLLKKQFDRLKKNGKR